MESVRLWFCALLFGPAVGSFCGLLLTRLPRHASVLAPRSHCRSCGRRLAATDLIPILSYLRLHGRCRHCGATIPRTHLAAEVAGTLAACAGATLAGWTGLWLALLLTVAAAVVWGTRHAADGTSLLEVAAAAAIISFVLLSALGMTSAAGLASGGAQRQLAALHLATAKLEDCRAQGYATLQTQLSSGACNGTESSIANWPGYTRVSALSVQDPSGTGSAVLLLRVTVTATSGRTARSVTLASLIGQGA